MSGRVASYNGLGGNFLGVKVISTVSTAYSVTVDDQGYLLIVGGSGEMTGGGNRLLLPKPEAGMRFDIFFTADTVTTATKITSSGTDQDIYVSDDTTGKGVALASTAQGGGGITVFGINDHRYVAWDFAGSSGTRAANSTST